MVWAPIWLPKLVFWERFSSIFCILLGSRTSNNIRHKLPNDAVPKQICIPIVHLPNMRLNHALPNMRPNHVLAKYASQSCTCQMCVPIMHLPNMHPKRALIKYASQACTCQICIPAQQHSMVARNMTRTCQLPARTMTPAADRLQPRGRRFSPQGGFD